MSKNFRVLGLQAENFKRLKAVDISPDPSEHIVKISGKNAQGKTSLLDAIWWALGGSTADRGSGTSNPVREGEDKAVVRVDMGDLVVTRTATAKGTKSLTVTNGEGAKYSSPQKMLDELLGALTFDPLAFTRMKPREQVDVLLGLVDLDVDLDELEEERKSLFDARREVGQHQKRLGELPEVDHDLPTEPESAQEIMDRLADAEGIVQQLENLDTEGQHLDDHIEHLQAELAKAKEKRMELIKHLETLPRAEQAVAHAQDIRQELAGLSERNQTIMDNNAARARAEEIGELSDKYKKYTAELKGIDAQKSAALAAAEFPLEGLSIDGDSVTFNGLPLSQASGAEQLRISTAIAVAANPQVRVARIADGSLMDADSHKLLQAIAAENDFQVWVELVADGDGVGFVIEDGEVV